MKEGHSDKHECFTRFENAAFALTGLGTEEFALTGFKYYRFGLYAPSLWTQPCRVGILSFLSAFAKLGAQEPTINAA